MRKIALALATGAALMAGTAVEAKPKLTGEEQLAKILEGREAGKPVNCISLFDSRDQRVIDKTAIVYDTLGPTIYVNRPKAGAAFLRDDAVLVTDTRSPELCNIDIVKLMDPGSRMLSGSVGLGDFVPYTKPKAERHD